MNHAVAAHLPHLPVAAALTGRSIFSQHEQADWVGHRFVPGAKQTLPNFSPATP